MANRGRIDAPSMRAKNSRRTGVRVTAVDSDRSTTVSSDAGVKRPSKPMTDHAPAACASGHGAGGPSAARILAAVRAIPCGKVAGYGVIARRAGLPGRARLVARILAGNDDPELPWHRVLRSDGRIAFPPDSPARAEQIRRLRAEGVVVANGRVRDQYTSGDSLDFLLWAAPAE